MAQLLKLINYGTSDLRDNTTATTITANNFIKRGVSNDEILLGGGSSSSINIRGALNGYAYYDNGFKLDLYVNSGEYSSLFNSHDHFGNMMTDVNNNLLYRADLRYKVTVTNFNSSNPDILFSLNYDKYNSNAINAGEIGEILIDLEDKFVTYSYGVFVITFYGEGHVPENVTLEMRTKNNTSEFTWKSIQRTTTLHDGVKPKGVNIEKDTQWVFANYTNYNCNGYRITITAQSSIDVWLTQICFYGQRMSLSQSPLLTKYLDLDIPYLNVTAKSLSIDGGTSSQFLKANGSLDSNSYSLSSHAHYIGTTKVQSSSVTQNLTGIGTISCGGITCTSITETSDVRKKENIQNLNIETYAVLDKINTYKYTYKDDTLKTARIGLIAQEVEEYFPEIVHTQKDGYKTIEYSKLGVLALDALKTLKHEIIKLNNRIKILESKNG